MTRRITPIALVLALAFGLAACGSPSSDTTSPPTGPSSSSMPSMAMPSQSTTSRPAETTSANTTEAVITITDFAYTVPATVAPGATITIKNGDSQAHTVTSKAGGFDIKVDPNGTATLTAPSKPGNYPFVCTFHADMTSTLVVG